MVSLKRCKRKNLSSLGGSRKRKGKRTGKRSARRRAKKMHKKRNKSNKRYASSPRSASEHNLSSHWSPSSSRFPSPRTESPKRFSAYQLRDWHNKYGHR